MQAKSIIFAHCCKEQIVGPIDHGNIQTQQSVLLYNYSMKLNHGQALLFALCLFACQPSTLSTVIIIDNSKVITLQTQERVPSVLLSQARITLNENDRILVNGFPVERDQPITNYPITLQTRRAVSITLITPQGQQQIQSSAFTVGEALKEAKIQSFASDQIDPPANTPISQPLTIQYVPSRALTVDVDGKSLQIQSSERTIGEAVAKAGIPLLGLNYSVPAENEPLPSDGQIKVVRVSESVVLAQKPIPFESDLQAAAEVPLDQTQILQPGEAGLSVQRVRVRYEDGKEISRVSENETVVRPPKTRILGYGTNVCHILFAV